jgi:hypothetical protein
MSSSGDNYGVQFGDSANVSGGIIAGAGSWVQGNQYRGADIEDIAGLRAALSLDPPVIWGNAFRGSFLHERFSQVDEGVDVPPLTLCAARRGLRIGGGRAGVPCGVGVRTGSGLVRPLSRAARRLRSTG